MASYQEAIRNWVKYHSSDSELFLKQVPEIPQVQVPGELPSNVQHERTFNRTLDHDAQIEIAIKSESTVESTTPDGCGASAEANHAVVEIRCPLRWSNDAFLPSSELASAKKQAIVQL